MLLNLPMRSWQMLVLLWKGSMTYLLALDVPTSTALRADGVRVPLMRLLAMLVRILGTLPDRLLIFLMWTGLSLSGALITWMIWLR